VVGIIMLFVLRESQTVSRGIRLRKTGAVQDPRNKVKLIDVIKYKNVLLSTINSIPIMAWLWIYTGFASLFLTSVHKLDMQWVGIIMSASGFGGFLGEFMMGAISDNIGRKKALIISAFLCACSGVSIALLPLGSSVALFSVLFFLWGMFGAGMYPMYLGTLPAESVPAEIAGTAIGIPTAVGEVLGAALMPTIAGVLADSFSLFAPMWMAAVAGVFVCIISIFYVETAPKCLDRMKTRPGLEDHLLRPFRHTKQATAPTK